MLLGFIQTLTALFHLSTSSLLWLRVAPELRRRGSGVRLMRAAEDFVIVPRYEGEAGPFMRGCGTEPFFQERTGYSGGIMTP